MADGFGARTVAVGAAPETLDRVARLRRLGVSFDSPGGNPVGTADTQVSRIAGSGLDALYEMRWHQPLPDPARFGLGRAGDDLLVTISGFRFPVRLPSVLRRCKVAGADWDDDEVRIRFTPTPPCGRNARRHDRGRSPGQVIGYLSSHGRSGYRWRREFHRRRRGCRARPTERVGRADR